ncbi:MAG: hypothetical protein ACOC0H_06690 [Thermodesulfobacteriota bacterium]
MDIRLNPQGQTARPVPAAVTDEWRISHAHPPQRVREDTPEIGVVAHGLFSFGITLPHLLNPIVLCNMKITLDIFLFEAVNETLQAFAADPKWRLKGQIGFTGVLPGESPRPGKGGGIHPYRVLRDWEGQTRRRILRTLMSSTTGAPLFWMRRFTARSILSCSRSSFRSRIYY